MKRIFLLNVGLSANYKVSWPNIFKIECPFASFENYIPTKKFLTHKSLFHRNHHIFLAQSFYPSCHYSTNTIKVQAKMELTLLSLQCLARKKMIVSFLQILLHIRCHILVNCPFRSKNSRFFPQMNDLVINFLKLISRKNCFDFFSGQTLVLIQTVAKWK